VKLQIPTHHDIDEKPSISGGATSGPPLTLDRFIIHYGPDSTSGSEHRINGKRLLLVQPQV